MKLFLIALVMNSRYQHSARLYSHHRTRRKVYYRNARLSHKLFRLVVSMNTGKDRAFFSRTVVKCEFEQFLGLRHRLARKHLDCAEIRTREGFKIYAVGKKRLDLYIGKIDLFLRRRRGNNGLGCFLRLLFTADRLKRRDTKNAFIFSSRNALNLTIPAYLFFSISHIELNFTMMYRLNGD